MTHHFRLHTIYIIRLHIAILLLFLVFKGDRKEEVAKVICIAWCFWSRRNTMFNESIVVQPLEAFERAVTILTIFQISRQKCEVLKLKAFKWETSSS